ncbi:MAG: dTMP kinase [Gammaproteobacteria bacterium]
MSGAFITVEGIDGAGKTTQIEFIASWLGAHGVEVARTREPGGTALGDTVRELVLKGDAPPPCAHAELLLIFAARAQNLHEVIEPALAAGRWVLCDRFIDSTYAYQGGGRGIDMDAIAWLEKWVQGARQPDLSVVLDVPVEVGRARTRRRDFPYAEEHASARAVGAAAVVADSAREHGGSPERFDNQTPQFQAAARRQFIERAARFERMHLIDANRAPGQISADIETLLETFRRQWRA